jgi:hypothetical protein
MKLIALIFISFTVLFCTPKGPVTYKSSFVGGTKAELFYAKGPSKNVKYFDTSEIHIYSYREDYLGKKVQFEEDIAGLPKNTTVTEHIYYINQKGIVYKYQVWKKKTRLN